MTCLSNWAKKEHDIQAESIFRLSFTCASVANVSNRSEREVKQDLNAVLLLGSEIFLGESARRPGNIEAKSFWGACVSQGTLLLAFGGHRSALGT